VAQKVVLLGREPFEISLLSNMQAIQGPAGIYACGRRWKLIPACTDYPALVKIRKEVKKRLKQETIEKLIVSDLFSYQKGFEKTPSKEATV
jgi:DNA-binding IscR family transcriptional regulator